MAPGERDSISGLVRCSGPVLPTITGPRRLIYIYLGPRQTLGTQGTRITTRLPCFRAVPFVESPFRLLPPSIVALVVCFSVHLFFIVADWSSWLILNKQRLEIVIFWSTWGSIWTLEWELSESYFVIELLRLEGKLRITSSDIFSKKILVFLRTFGKTRDGFALVVTIIFFSLIGC